MSDKDIEEFKQELIYSIECIQEGTSCDEGFSYTCFGEGDIEQVLKIIEELETYKKIAEKLAEVVDLGYMPFECSPMCIHDNCIKECALDWARKEVEKDD